MTDINPTGLLAGKKLVVTGVLTDASIAYAVARLAIEQGAEVVLTSHGRAMSITKRIARRLPVETDVLELDVTQPEHFTALTAALQERWGRVDGVLHAVAFAPASCLSGDFMAPEWADVATALEISAYSLKALAGAMLPLMGDGGAIVGLDFDATQAWPSYDWMGVSKAALEATARYLARDLGPKRVRVNLVAAGPLRTMAAKSISGFGRLRGALGDARAARVGRRGHRAGGAGLRRAAVRLVRLHHRRDRARRRRVPRRRRLIRAARGLVVL